MALKDKLYVASALDPRFKALPFLSDDAQDDTFSRPGVSKLRDYFAKYENYREDTNFRVETIPPVTRVIR